MAPSRKNKIPERWEEYSNVGAPIEGTRFLAFKVPLNPFLASKLSPELVFRPEDLLKHFQTHRLNVKAILDLTNTDRYYDAKFWDRNQIQHFKVNCDGDPNIDFPPPGVYEKFKEVVDQFLEIYFADESALLGVHCTHGLNRTGYFVCRYMIEVLGCPAQDAVNAFNAARGHEMEKYIDELIEIERSIECGSQQRRHKSKHKHHHHRHKKRRRSSSGSMASDDNDGLEEGEVASSNDDDSNAKDSKHRSSRSHRHRRSHHRSRRHRSKSDDEELSASSSEDGRRSRHKRSRRSSSRSKNTTKSAVVPPANMQGMFVAMFRQTMMRNLLKAMPSQAVQQPSTLGMPAMPPPALINTQLPPPNFPPVAPGLPMPAGGQMWPPPPPFYNPSFMMPSSTAAATATSTSKASLDVNPAIEQASWCSTPVLDESAPADDSSFPAAVSDQTFASQQQTFIQASGDIDHHLLHNAAQYYSNILGIPAPSIVKAEQPATAETMPQASTAAGDQADNNDDAAVGFANNEQNHGAEESSSSDGLDSLGEIGEDEVSATDDDDDASCPLTAQPSTNAEAAGNEADGSNLQQGEEEYDESAAYEAEEGDESALPNGYYDENEEAVEEEEESGTSFRSASQKRRARRRRLQHKFKTMKRGRFWEIKEMFEQLEAEREAAQALAALSASSPRRDATSATSTAVVGPTAADNNPAAVTDVVAAVIGDGAAADNNLLESNVTAEEAAILASS